MNRTFCCVALCSCTPYYVACTRKSGGTAEASGKTEISLNAHIFL